MPVNTLAVVIPCYRENQFLGSTLSSLEQSLKKVSKAQSRRIHVIPVVNQEMDAPAETDHDNQALLERLKCYQGPLQLSILDHTRPGIKHGVGEARDLGARYAIETLGAQNLCLLNLDADCLVNEHYFSFLFSLDTIKFPVFTLGFAHPIDANIKAITLYEIYLRYMKWQWTRIGVPFDFYPIGSCIGIEAATYLRHGGFLHKDATEDFHFLNKMNKFKSIKYYSEILVYPSSRGSDRVYLGTGHFVSNYDEAVIHPSFPLLASPQDYDAFKQVWNALTQFYIDETSWLLTLQDPCFGPFLLRQRLNERLRLAKENSTSVASFQRKIPHFFDATMGFRLLKVLAKRPYLSTEFLGWCATMLGVDTLEPTSLLLEFRKKDAAWSKDCRLFESEQSVAPFPL